MTFVFVLQLQKLDVLNFCTVVINKQGAFKVFQHLAKNMKNVKQFWSLKIKVKKNSFSTHFLVDNLKILRIALINE